jgi:hypothetical protein
MPAGFPGIRERDSMQSTTTTVFFPQPFRLTGHAGEMPAGEYELLVQEETVAGPGSPTRRWTAAYLTDPAAPRKAGRRERVPLSGPDLARALRHSRMPAAVLPAKTT